MKKVLIESPLRGVDGNFDRNIRYSRLCGLDCIRRGEAPYAGHLLLTQFLDDTIPDHRRVGMEAGFSWGKCAELVAVYVDLGTSSGMEAGIERATLNGQAIEYRNLPADLMAMLDGPGPAATPGAT